MGDLSYDMLIGNGATALQYFVRLHGEGFGPDNDKVFALHRWNGGPDENEITLKADFAGDQRVTGDLTISNSSSTDIFTWELGCSFKYSLVDEYGVEYASEHSDSHPDTSERVRFVSPVNLHGTLLQGTEQKFKIKLPAGLGATPKCNLNGRNVAIEVAQH